MSYGDFTEFKGQPATIRWFDNLSGEGMVRLADDSCLYLHYSAIEGAGRDVWVSFPHDKDIPCEVEIIDDDTFRQVLRLRCAHTIIEKREK